MLKAYIFHWQIFRDGFNTEKYVDDEKFLCFAEYEHLKFKILEMMTNDEAKRNIISSFLRF